MSSIAILSTYPPSEGFGGPARIHHQRRVLEAAGHSVTNVCIVSNPPRTGARPGDLTVLVERPFRAPVDHIYDDVDLGRRAATDPRVVADVAAHLDRAGIDLVILEQPFLVELLERVLGHHPATVVYSCQNIEYRLRRDLERFQPDWRRPRRRADDVRELEQQAVRVSAEVTAICPTDQAALLDEFGCESVLVPNGSSVADASTSPARARPADFVFAGSSYWPNVDGFAEIASPSLAFLPPTDAIDVAGSVGQALLEHPVLSRRTAITRSRLRIHGFLEMGELVALMASARAVIVPVFTGEGSNLKSADALASGAPVIMTRRATHGYEDVIADDDDGITVVDTAREFRAAMLAAAGRPRPDGPVGHGRRALLGWDHRLQPLLSVVNRRSST